MEQRAQEIGEYYDMKADHYKKKYGFGAFTHIHSGIYDSSVSPLFDLSEAKIQKLGVEYIKYLLFQGQENTIRYLLNIFKNHNTKSLLDLGCGNGGTSLYLKLLSDMKITALTISRSQEQEVKRVVNQIGLSRKIDVKEINIFNYGGKDDLFGGILALESISQIGNIRGLMKKLNNLLAPNGILVISDVFLKSQNDKLRRDFNYYWKSDLSCVGDLMDSVSEQRLNITQILDFTEREIPFWKLSIAYSKSLLHVNTQEFSGMKKLQMSIKYESILREALAKREIVYLIAVIEK